MNTEPEVARIPTQPTYALDIHGRVPPTSTLTDDIDSRSGIMVTAEKDKIQVVSHITSTEIFYSCSIQPDGIVSIIRSHQLDIPT